MDVTVIIPARDAAATLPSTLAAIAGQEGEFTYEVIVVDDGSRDGTRAVVEQAPGSVQLLRTSGQGPAAARNRGARAGRGRLLAFTDADCTPAPGWLAAGIAAARTAQLVQGRVEPPPGVRAGPFDRHITVLAEYGLYETANLFIHRALFERLGGFESILRPRGGKELGEDVWLGWRARRAGASTAFAADALVHHVVFPRVRREYVAERWRLRFFPELVRRIPELRDAFLYRGVFLNARSAKFDLAVAGVATAVLTRRAAPMLLVIPYLRVAPHGGAGAAGVAADAVSAAALTLGSVRSRTILL